MVTWKSLSPTSCSVGRSFSAGRGQALGRGDRESLDLLGLDLRGGVGGLVAHQVDLAADQVGHRRAGALVRHRRSCRSYGVLEQQAAQVRGRADAGIAQVDLALVGSIQARSSLKLLAGSEGRPISVIGTSLIMPRYSKSLSTLNGMLRTSVGHGGHADVVQQQRVAVGGGGDTVM